MKSIKNGAIVLALCLFVSCSNASGEKDIVIDESEVASAVEALNNALVDPQTKLLEGLVSEKLTYGHSGGNIQNKQEFIDDLVNGPFDFLSINASDQHIAIYGSTAVARHIMSAKGENKGESVDVHIGIILIFQKEKGSLKLLARQAYKL